MLASLPATSFSVAYGSGAFHQPGLYDRNLDRDQGRDRVASTSSTSTSTSTFREPAPMLDMLLAVGGDTVAWHAANLERNPTHYSTLSRLAGPAFVARLADRMGAGLHFNSLVPFCFRGLGGRGKTSARLHNSPANTINHDLPSPTTDETSLIKYGVASETRLISDCLAWTDMYTAGRLQKPILRVLGGGGDQQPPLGGGDSGSIQPDDVSRPPPLSSDSASRRPRPPSSPEDKQDVFDGAVEVTRSRALLTAVLLMPSGGVPFTERQLFAQIVRLSYLGDIRVGWAEDRRKVLRIVEGSFHQLRRIYAHHIHQAMSAEVLRFAPFVRDATRGEAGGEIWYMRVDEDVPGLKARILASLPPAILHRLHRATLGGGPRLPDVPEVTPATARDVLAAMTTTNDTAIDDHHGDPFGRHHHKHSTISGAPVLSITCPTGTLTTPTTTTTSRVALPRPRTSIRFLDSSVSSALLGPGVAEEVALVLSRRHPGREHVAVMRAIKQAVRWSSVRQACAGLVAAGGVTAVRYVGRKMMKALKSRSESAIAMEITTTK